MKFCRRCNLLCFEQSTRKTQRHDHSDVHLSLLHVYKNCLNARLYVSTCLSIELVSSRHANTSIERCLCLVDLVTIVWLGRWNIDMKACMAELFYVSLINIVTVHEALTAMTTALQVQAHRQCRQRRRLRDVPTRPSGQAWWRRRVVRTDIHPISRMEASSWRQNIRAPLGACRWSIHSGTLPSTQTHLSHRSSNGQKWTILRHASMNWTADFQQPLSWSVGTLISCQTKT